MYFKETPQMVEYISDYYEDVKSITKEYMKKYIVRIQQLLDQLKSGSFSTEHHTIKQSSSEAKGTTGQVLIDGIFSNISNSYAELDTVRRIMELVNKIGVDRDHYTSEYSDSFYSKLSEKFNSLNHKYDKYQKVCEGQTKSLYNSTLSSPPFKGMSMERLYDTIYEAYSKNSNLFDFYMAIMEHIGKTPLENGLATKIRKNIESEKTRVLLESNSIDLDAESSVEDERPDVYFTNPDICTYGLRIGEQVQLADVFSALKVKPPSTVAKSQSSSSKASSSKASSSASSKALSKALSASSKAKKEQKWADEVKMLDKLSTDAGVGIITMHREIYRPIIFEVDQLLRPPQYSYTKTMGINRGIVESHKTVKFSPDQKWKFKTHCAVKADHKHVIILLYLGVSMLYYMKTDRSFGGDKEHTQGAVHSMLIERDKVEEFIEYATNLEKKKILKTRVDAYNGIVEKDILSKMFFKNRVNTSKFDEYAGEAIETKYLVHSIYVKFMDMFRKMKIKTFDEMEQFVFNDDFLTTLTSMIIDYLQNGNIHFRRDKHKFPDSEIYIVFMRELNENKKTFFSEMNTVYTSLKSKHKDSPVTPERVEEIYDAVVNESLKKLISERKNIFKSILLKNEYLNL